MTSTSPRGSRILITGGAGFIGSAVAARLVDANEVVVYDDFSRRPARFEELRRHPHVRIVEGDVLDAAKLSAAMRDTRIVVHCAAIAGVDTVLESPVRTMRVNMLGSANVLEAASLTATCERVVCFSTSEVFGSVAFRADEAQPAVTGAVGEARWTYAVSKLAEEHLALAYHRERGLPVTIVRPFNIYGPGQVGPGAVRTFVQRALRGEALEIHGDGTQIRAWCYIDDMVEGTLIASVHPAAIGEAFNIGNQRAVVTIYGLANTIVRVLSSRSPIVFARKDYTDVELRVPSVDKARRILGFEARVDLEEGIRLTAEHYRLMQKD